MKVDKIYTEVSLGGELYKVKMNIIPQEYEPKVWSVNHMKKHKCHTTQEVSKEVPIINTIHNIPMGNNAETCSCEEELTRDMHQETPQLHQHEQATTSAILVPTMGEDNHQQMV